MNKKLKRFFCQIEGWVNPLEFNAYSKADARKLCLDYLNTSKLPKGTIIYR